MMSELQDKFTKMGEKLGLSSDTLKAIDADFEAKIAPRAEEQILEENKADMATMGKAEKKSDKPKVIKADIKVKEITPEAIDKMSEQEAKDLAKTLLAAQTTEEMDEGEPIMTPSLQDKLEARGRTNGF